jgi:TPR repeat protein
MTLKNIRFISLIAAVLVALVVSGVAGVALAQDAGNKAYDRGDYAEAYFAWLPLAEKGDAGYQFNLGAVIETKAVPGKGIDDAVVWYLRAAKKVEREAIIRLGEIYLLGLSPAITYGKLIRPFNNLIGKGDIDALFMKGLIEERLIELQPSMQLEAPSRALANYRLAHGLGHPRAADYIRDLEGRYSQFYLSKADSYERSYRNLYWGK